MVSEPLGRAVSPERLFLDSPPQALPLSLPFGWLERERHVLAPRPPVQAPTERQRSGAPLSPCSPRSSNEGPEPASRSFTGPGDEDLRRSVPRLSTW